MYCSLCNEKVLAHTRVCPNCGAEFEKKYVKKRVRNEYATGGLIMSFLVPIIGFICSIIGLKNARLCEGKGKVRSVLGIIISVLMFAAPIVAVVVVIKTGVLNGLIDQLTELISGITR